MRKVMGIELFTHQLQALEQTKDKNHVAYYLDMGLGKTFVGSEKILELNAPYNLLVCQKSKIKDWEEHFRNHYDLEVVVYNNQPVECIAPNSVIIVNYDLVWRRGQLNQLKNFTLMLDESQYIKNETTSRAEFVLKLKPDNVILLSGTPTGGKYEELWSQLRLLGWRITKELFYNQFTIVKKRKIRSIVIKEIIGYKNVDRLKEKLRFYGAVFMKTEDVFDLPEQLETTLNVENTLEYKEFARNGCVTVDGDILLADIPLTRLLCLRQLASIYNENKHQVLIDTLKSSDDRFVVFYNFNSEFELIKAICAKLDKPLSYINGEGTDLENYENMKDSVSLVQYQAGASGVNLQRANKMIYFSLPLSCELWMQSKKRIHRIGQGRCCFYYYLITLDSVEERILEVLKERRDFTVELFEKSMASI
jgi:SNF2 family DNA or RNA helicase